MCGIAGTFSPSRAGDGDWLQNQASRMSGALAHRGPDASGIWTDQSAGIALGHSRLAVIDPSFDGHQPMSSRGGDHVLIFNGEIYNFDDLRCRLIREGERFRGHSDTEVFLASLVRWGVGDTLRSSNGMFAFALWDRKERRLTLGRDRLGQKPLYYGWVGTSFVFGSELKAFTAHDGFAAHVDPDAVGLFLRFGYVPEPWCIWSGLAKLSPGTLVEIHSSDVLARRIPKVQRYWSARTAARLGSNHLLQRSDDASEKLDALLSDAVRLCMVSDVPIGAFLSGGVDSSLITALMQAHSPHPVRTFTIGFSDTGFDEATYAREIARHLGTDHTDLYISEADALRVIPSLPVLYDEPFADPSQIPTYLLSKLAREHVTVSLSGDGGDELFGGYNRYRWGQAVARTMHALPVSLRSSLGWLAGGLPVSGWDALAKVLPNRVRPPQLGDKMQKLIGILDVDSREEMYWQLASVWQYPDGTILGSGSGGEKLQNFYEWPATGHFVTDMMLLDTETYLPGDILTKLDRASMGVGLEARVPFLDHRVVEFAWLLPLSMKLKRGQSKWIIRQILRRYVPDLLLDRPKTGFNVPIDRWLRGALRPWAEELLDERTLRNQEFLEPSVISALWAEHLGGNHNRQHELWNILMFQAWLAHQS